MRSLIYSSFKHSFYNIILRQVPLLSLFLLLIFQNAKNDHNASTRNCSGGYTSGGVSAFTFSSPQSRPARFLLVSPSPQRSSSSSTTRIFLDGEGMAGGSFNKHLLGDVLRALQPRYLSQVKDSLTGNLRGAANLDEDALSHFLSMYGSIENARDVDDTIKSPVGIPSWSELELLLEKQQTSYEKLFRGSLERGEVHSALASFRRFGKKNKKGLNEQMPIATLYRDSASWCPYCQKVWIALEEKRIPYEIIKVDMNCYASGSKPGDFLKIQPNGNLPCMVIQTDGNIVQREVLGESDAILDALDEMGTLMNPDTPKLNFKKGTEEEQQMKALCNDGRNSLERRLYSEWMWFLTGKRKPLEYKERYEMMLDEVNDALGNAPNGGPYFMGRQLTMADVKFIPFLERQAASLAYFKGFNVRNTSRWPNVERWLRAMEERESYRATKSDYYTHSRALPPQLAAGCSDGAKEEYEDMRNNIDASSLPSSSSSRPKKEALDWKEPGWEWCDDEKVARREAAERLFSNRERIVKFAARAAGTPGFPAASAPLADPRAVSNDMAERVTDVFLRHVVHSLLMGNSKDGGKKSLEVEICLNDAASELAKGGVETVRAIVDCLDYLRMRIGVPRDMSYPAARELKNELLSTAYILLDASDTEASSSAEKVKEMVSGTR